MQILNIQIGGLGFATLQNWSTDQYQELANNNIDILYLDTHANQQEQLSNQVQSLSANTHGAGGDLYSGMKSFEAIEEQIQRKIQDYDLIIIIAGFGGGTGSSFTKEVVRLCNSNNKFCFVIGNTLKRHEQYFDTPKNTYELVTEYLDTNCPYLLINSVKIQNELAQTNQQARVYEKYFANLSFSILSSFNLCLNAGIDLSDIQNKLGLGLTHFAIANSNEINENYRTLTFDNYYKGKVRNLKSYLLLYPVLVSQENQDQLLEKFDQEFEVSDCKIQAIDGDIFVFLGRLTRLDANPNALEVQNNAFRREAKVPFNQQTRGLLVSNAFLTRLDANPNALEVQTDAFRREANARLTQPTKRILLDMMNGNEELKKLITTKSAKGGKSAQEVANIITTEYNIHTTKNIIESLRK